MALLQYNGMNVVTVGLKGCDPVVIMPGINEVDDNKFALLRAHPSFGARVRDGKVIILASPKLDEQGRKSISDMLAYIPKIFDVKLLKKILKEDDRSQVVEAANNQLDIIMGKKQAKPESQNVEHFK